MKYITVKTSQRNIFGGSLTGDIFSRKHRDLTIELTINR